MSPQFAALSRDQRLAIAFRCCVQLLDRGGAVSAFKSPLAARQADARGHHVHINVAVNVASARGGASVVDASALSDDEFEDTLPDRVTGATLSSYLNEIKQIEHIDPEEEVALFQRFHAGDEKARDTLIRANLWLVPVVVRKFAGNGITLDDLVEEGNLALFSALERFDPSKEVRFSTYAKWWILKAATQARRSMAYPLRVPRLANKASVEELALVATDNGNDRSADVAEVLSIQSQPRNAFPPSKQATTPRIDSISLDDATTHLDQKAVETLGGQYSSEVEQSVVIQQALDTLFQALDTLPERERLVIEHRYALNDKTEMTLQELGDILGVTAERVRKIQISAMEKLKQYVFPSAK
jgi:RNA polymerase sigma factor (sigma-70 family)